MPKTIVLLMVWFLWATGKDLDALVRFTVSTDYYIFAAAGVPWLFFLVAFVVFMFDTAAVYCLYRPQPFGYWAVMSALVAGAVQNVVTIALAIPNLAKVREAYAIGREARGLPVREEGLDLLFSECSMLVMAVVMLGIYALLALMASRQRQYFLVPMQHDAV